jgi:hypothetical protein
MRKYSPTGGKIDAFSCICRVFVGAFYKNIWMEEGKPRDRPQCVVMVF